MKTRVWMVLAFAILVAAPLAGRLVIGLPPEFGEIPPLTEYVAHAPFSLPVFLLFAVFGLIAVTLFVRPWRFGFKRSPLTPAPRPPTPFPWWGWIGLVLNLAFWAFAWGRFDWLGPLRDHTFFPLWFGFILVLDGLVRKRSGASRISRAPGPALGWLFPASAVAWWYFEYLNRFMQNWRYAGVEGFSALHYVSMATFSFSTVLPAVFEIVDLLRTFPWFRGAYADGPKILTGSDPLRGLTPSCFVVLGAVGLFLLGRWPNPWFFLTWLAPLAVLAGCLALAGIETPFTALKKGDWSFLLTLAAAALVCGFFWEMWNVFSMPKWHYTVPYVGIARIFEMPVVGYGGYLPFGPICWCYWLALRALANGRTEP